MFIIGSAGILFIVSGVKIFEINCTTENKCQQFELKFAAGVSIYFKIIAIHFSKTPVIVIHCLILSNFFNYSPQAMSLILAVLNGAIGANVLTNRKDVERDALVEDK